MNATAEPATGFRVRLAACRRWRPAAPACEAARHAGPDIAERRRSAAERP